MGNVVQQVKLARRRALRDKRIKQKLAAQESLGSLTDFAGAASMACIDNPGKITDFYYIESEKIGEGSYGRVCRCSNVSTGAPRAVKILKKVRDKREVRRFRQEIVLLRQLDHPHIAKLFEHFENQRYMYMVMQLCEGGELFDHLINAGHYTENQTATVMQQLFRAVFYMHSANVAHRDLKLENLMLLRPGPVEGNTVKVVDFGSAKFFDDSGVMQTKIGAPYFIAPQILAGRYNELVDMWTLGVVMYCLMCGYPPFFGDSDAEILAKVRVGYFYFNATDWKHVSEAAKNLVRSLLKVNQADRLTAKQALFDEWVSRKASMWRAPFKLRYVDNMRLFGPMNKLKKATLTIMAAQLDEEYTGPLIETFMSLDESGEGTISAEEMKEGLVKSGIVPEEIPADLEALCKQVDGNGSGELTISEFVASTLDPRIYTNEEFCWAAFRIFDRNCDGKISVKELRDTMTNGAYNAMSREEKEQCTEEHTALLEEVDEDGDGELDFTEFMHMMLGTTKKRIANKKLKTHEDKVAGAAMLANRAKEQGKNIVEMMQEQGGIEEALKEAADKAAKEKAAAEAALKAAAAHEKEKTKEKDHAAEAKPEATADVGDKQDKAKKPEGVADAGGGAVATRSAVTSGPATLKQVEATPASMKKGMTGASSMNAPKKVVKKSDEPTEQAKMEADGAAVKGTASSTIAKQAPASNKAQSAKAKAKTAK